VFQEDWVHWLELLHGAGSSKEEVEWLVEKISSPLSLLYYGVCTAHFSPIDWYNHQYCTVF